MLPGAAAGDGLPLYGAPGAPEIAPEGGDEAPPPRGGRRRLLLVAGAVVVVLAVVTLLGVLTRSEARWSEDGYGIRRPLVAGVADPPEEAWRSDIEATASVGLGDLVIVGEGGTGDLVALDGRRGSERWRIEPPASAARVEWLQTTSSHEVLVGYRDNLGRDDGVGVALVSDAGRVRWQRPGADAAFALPLDGGNLIALFSASGGDGVVVLDGGDGRVHWRTEDQAVGLGEDVLYVAHEDEVRAVDLDDGEVRWSEPRRQGVPQGSWASEVDGTFVLARGRSRLVGLSPTSGDERWERTVDDRIWSVVDAGEVAVALGQTKAWGIDPDDGDVLWSAGPDHWFARPPVRMSGVDGALLVLPTGEVERIDLRTGKSAGRSGRAGPGLTGETAVADGLVYLPDRSELRAIDVDDLSERWTVDIHTRFDAVAADDVVVAVARDHLVAYR